MFIKKKSKIISVITLSILLAGAALIYTYKPGLKTVLALIENVTSDLPDNSGQTLMLLNYLAQVKGLKIDDTMFMDPLFKSLEDFSTPVVPEPVKRVDPFAPIGTETGTIYTGEEETAPAKKTTTKTPVKTPASSPSTPASSGSGGAGDDNIF